MPLPGVYVANKKNGELYYRSSITYRNKHISLGSFDTEKAAHAVYQSALKILNKKKSIKKSLPTAEAFYALRSPISFDKWIMLLNFRDNGIYCRTPIYLQHKYFLYYLDEHTPLKFDADDLFYYMYHRIMKRGGHLFVSDYGMQVNILSRYGIKNFAVAGRDYRFSNGDSTDFRYGNIKIINRYHGVQKTVVKGQEIYTTRIHINGDYIVGKYGSEIEAAIAYNKAASLLKSKGLEKDFPENYIEGVDHIAYAKLYNSLRISKKLRDLPNFN